MTPSTSARAGIARRRALPLLSALTIGLAASAAHAVTPIGFTGDYTQNFDTLPSAGGTINANAAGPTDVPATGGTLPGWQYQGTTGTPSFRVDNGGSNGGATYSYGTTDATERALGALPSASTISRIGAIFRNDSATTYTSFTLNYNGEQWRYGGSAGNPNAFRFNYSVLSAAPDIATSTAEPGTAVPNLDFVSPVVSGTSGALDGNVAPNRAAIAGSVTGLSWAPGQFLVIRFDVTRPTSGSASGLGIDDVALTASATAVQTNPALSNPLANPGAVEQGKTTLLSVKVAPGANPVSTGIAVTGNLTIIGGSATQPFFDDGTNGDVAANDNVYSYRATVASTAAVGTPSIAVRVVDTQNRTDTTSINLTVLAQTFPSTTLVISEFRATGPGTNIDPLADEFIEILNISNAPIDIAGYQLFYSSSGGSNPSSRTVTYGPTTVIPAGQRFLFAAVGSSEAPNANATFTAFIADTGGFALVSPSGAIIDAVGQSSGTQLKEGSPVSGLTNTATQSYERRQFSVNRQDTQDNSADFGPNTANPQGLTPGGANNPPRLNNATYSAAVNTAFSQQLAGTDADNDTLSYALASGTTLPAGLTLSGTGLISGTPTVAGRTDFAVTVADGRGGTLTARFIIIVGGATDALAPQFTRSAIPASLTRDQLAAITLTGNITDIAQPGGTASGVSRLIFQLRRNSDSTSYSGPTNGFTADRTRGYYPGTLSAATTADATRNYSRSLSFVPNAGALTPGGYELVIAGQDVAGNWSVEVVPFTITAPAISTPPTSAPITSGRIS